MAAMQDRELGVEGAGPTFMLVNAEAEQGCRGPVKLHSSSEQGAGPRVGWGYM